MYLLIATVTLISTINAEYQSRFASITEFPYAVQLEFNGNFICGGSIISSEYVLTSRHCVSKDHFFSSAKIRAGASTRSRDGSVHKIEQILDSDNTHSAIAAHEVALIRVSPPFELDDTRKPVELFEAGEKSIPGNRSVVVGWEQAENPRVSSVLQAVQVPIVDEIICGDAFVPGVLPLGLICAGLFNEGMCLGDAGAPLTIGGRQAGIAQLDGCSDIKRPITFLEVAHYRDWIANVTGV